jgi:hypothetical protein
MFVVRIFVLLFRFFCCYIRFSWMRFLVAFKRAFIHSLHHPSLFLLFFVPAHVVFLSLVLMAPIICWRGDQRALFRHCLHYALFTSSLPSLSCKIAMSWDEMRSHTTNSYACLSDAILRHCDAGGRGLGRLCCYTFPLHFSCLDTAGERPRNL